MDFSLPMIKDCIKATCIKDKENQETQQPRGYFPLCNFVENVFQKKNELGKKIFISYVDKKSKQIQNVPELCSWQAYVKNVSRLTSRADFSRFQFSVSKVVLES